MVPVGTKFIRNDPVRRFWSKVKKTATCWLWTGSLVQKGYGMFYVGAGREVKAHVYSFFLAHGRYPQHHGLHTCDVRNCVNPEHIVDGTQIENIRQRDARGRMSRKLTDKQIVDIKLRLRNGDAVSELARVYHVGLSTIYDIYYGRTWKNIEP